MNMPGIPPQPGILPQPGLFPQSSGFPPMASGQLLPFPGRTGRVTIVCCAIPE